MILLNDILDLAAPPTAVMLDLLDGETRETSTGTANVSEVNNVIETQSRRATLKAFDTFGLFKKM